VSRQGSLHPTAQSEVAGVVGWPVRHSLSPVLYNAAFQAMGLDWVYVAFEVPPEQGEGLRQAMLTLGIRGLSVTMPHKAAAASCADLRSEVVELIKAANTLTLRGKEVHADSTDGEGVLRALAWQGVEVAGRSAVVVGAGGAASVAALALARTGVRDLAILARRRRRAEELAGLVGPPARVGEPHAVGEADLVVQATPVGMAGGPDPAGYPFDPGLIRRGQVILEMVYHPIVTPLAKAAGEAGAKVVPGHYMLLHVAAATLELWTGAEAPLADMLVALEEALGRG